MGLIYISGLVLGLLSTVIALLGVAVLITYSPQNGAILRKMDEKEFIYKFCRKTAKIINKYLPRHF